MVSYSRLESKRMPNHHCSTLKPTKTQKYYSFSSSQLEEKLNFEWIGIACSV